MYWDPSSCCAYGVASERIFFVPHFVDNDLFAARAAASRSRRREIRAQWAANEDTMVLLFAGKLIRKKRPMDLLKVTRILHEQNVPVLSLIVGSGDLDEQLREFSRVHRLPVKFVGFKNQAELPDYYVSADALVLPSDGGETWGLVINEAMACGLPPIVSDEVGSAPDLIEEGRTGFTFPCGNIDGLLRQIMRTNQLIKAGFDFAPHLNRKLTQYSVSTAASKACEAFDSMSQKGS